MKKIVMGLTLLMLGQAAQAKIYCISELQSGDSVKKQELVINSVTEVLGAAGAKMSILTADMGDNKIRLIIEQGHVRSMINNVLVSEQQKIVWWMTDFFAGTNLYIRCQKK